MHVCPSIRMQSAFSSVSHPPIHPPTHLTPPAAASNCSHHPELRLWLHTGQLRILFLRQHAPDSSPSHLQQPSLQSFNPPYPTLPSTDHVTFRKASPTSPLLSLTLSWLDRCQRLSAARWLAAFSLRRGFKGKSDTSLISLGDQSIAWSKCWISIF